MALVDHELNPIPDGAASGYVKAADGTKIRFARWMPAGTARGTVVIVQGRAEYIEKYFETVRDLLARDLAVVAFDLRGQGGSERMARNPQKGHVGSFLDYVADLDAVLDQIVFIDCPAPIFALGHSTGSTVLILAAAQGRSRFRRQVLVSPFLGLPPDGPWEAPSRIAARLLTGLGLGRLFVPGRRAYVMHAQAFEGNALTSDRARYERNCKVTVDHAEIAIGAPTIGWINAGFQAMSTIFAEGFTPRLRVPTLMIASGDERVVSTAATELLSQMLKVGHLVVLAGARHEILQEQDALREQFWAGFDAFIRHEP